MTTFRDWLRQGPDHDLGVSIDDVPDIGADNEDKIPKALVVWCSHQTDAVSAKILARYVHFSDRNRPRPVELDNRAARRVANIMDEMHLAATDGERWLREDKSDEHSVSMWKTRCAIQTRALRDALRELRLAVQL